MSKVAKQYLPNDGDEMLPTVDFYELAKMLTALAADEGSPKPPLGFIPDETIQVEMMEFVTTPRSMVTNVEAMAQQTTKIYRAPTSRNQIGQPDRTRRDATAASLSTETVRARHCRARARS